MPRRPNHKQKIIRKVRHPEDRRKVISNERASEYREALSRDRKRVKAWEKVVEERLTR